MAKSCGGVFIEKSSGGVIMAKLIIGDKSTKIIDDNDFINVTINRKITDMNVIRDVIKSYGKMYETFEIANSSVGKIVMPKGTFDKIFEDDEDDEDDV